MVFQKRHVVGRPGMMFFQESRCASLVEKNPSKNPRSESLEIFDLLENLTRSRVSISTMINSPYDQWHGYEVEFLIEPTRDQFSIIPEH